ncbi:hypothetical protein EBT11_08545 [bacterium]|nr:hypothetical protein [bacterium]
MLFPIDTETSTDKDYYMKHHPNPHPEKQLNPIWRFILLLLLTCGLTPAQEIPKSAFNLVNLIPQPIPLKLSLDTNLICAGDESVGPGFLTGLMPWRPEKATLKAEVKGYQTAELKPFLKATETPLIILQESSPHVLQFNVIPNSKERSPSFYDAINLTTKDNLEIQANKNSFSLPKNKRIRLSKEKKLSYALLGKQQEDLDPSDPGNFLLVFYTREDGTQDCIVIPDNPL